MRCYNLATWIVMAGLAFGHTAHATFTGDYNYVGYYQEFHSGIIPSVGETKTIGVDYSDITVTSTNFLAYFREYYLARTISNEFTPDMQVRCINNYAANMMTGDEPEGEGTIETAPYGVLNIYPDDEPDLMIPFYFSRNTNIAMNISGTSTNEEHEIDFGLLVRKGSGMNNSMLNGTYIRYTLGNTVLIDAPGCYDGISLDRAVMAFDGSGNYTENTDAWSVWRITGETNLLIGSDTLVQTYSALSEAEETSSTTNGTYSLLSNGTLLISSDMGTITNQLSPDGNLAASTLAIDLGVFSGVYLTVVVRQPDNMLTNAIDAVYFLGEIEERFDSISENNGINNNTIGIGRTYVFLKSDGTFSIRSDYWDVENTMGNFWTDIDPAPSTTNLVAITQFNTEDSEKVIEFQSGTYAIQTNGTVTLDFGNGETGEAQLSENGEYLAYAFIWGDETEAARTLAVGIRRDPPPPAPAPIIFNDDLAMTPTGLVMTATMPTNYPVEGISTDDLTGGEWYSGGLFSTPTGTLQIHDPFATNSAVLFYGTTFAPW